MRRGSSGIGRRAGGSPCRALLTALAALATFASLCSAAAAAPAVNGVYDLTGEPKYIARGPDGNIWTTLAGSSAGNEIAKITPAGVVTEYDVAALNNAIGITAGPDGNLWATQANQVVKVPPANPPGATAFNVASITDPRGITAGPDDNLWTGSGDKVIRIPPADPTTFTDFPVAGLGARGISAGSNLIWVADFASGRIISLTTAGVPTPYDVGGNPQEVAAAPGTEQVAYGNPGTDPQTVGRITPGGLPMPTNVPPMTDPFGVTRGADGAWWYAQFAVNSIGRLTANGAYTVLGGLPAASGPRQITDGPGQTLWVALETSHQVARVTGVEPPAPPAGKPQTKIDKAPKKKLKAGRKGATAKLRFSSPTAGAKFECALKRKGKANKREKKLAKFASCKSPKTYKKLRKGKYTFKVRAVVGSARDASPATAMFKVRR